MSYGLVIEITEKGKQLVEKARGSDGIFPNYIHLLSGLYETEGGMHYPNFFEEFNYASPTLNECRKYLLKNGCTTEHN